MLVASRLCNSRATIAWQSWVVWGYFSGFHVLGCACDCRVTVVLLSYDCCAIVMRVATLSKRFRNMPGSIRMNPTKSPTDSRSNSCISVLYCPNIRRLSIHSLTHQHRAFLYGSRARIYISGLCFALVGDQQSAYSTVPNIIVLVEQLFSLNGRRYIFPNIHSRRIVFL